MKNILSVLCLFLIYFSYGQKVSDYQYIHVPQKFQDFEPNKYGLNDLLISKLKQKKFIVISDQKENLSQNPCQVLNVEILDASTMFKNKVKIEFKDCNKGSIISLVGGSSIKEFEAGMRDALEQAVKNIPSSNPVEKIEIVQTNETLKSNQQIELAKQGVAVQPETKSVQVVPAPKTVATASQKEELYDNGSVKLNRIFLDNGSFILVSPNSSVPFASFKPATKKDVYRVQLSDGSSTLGYLENGTIVIEMPNSTGDFRKEIFERK